MDVHIILQSVAGGPSKLMAFQRVIHNQCKYHSLASLVHTEGPPPDDPNKNRYHLKSYWMEIRSS